MEEYTLLMIKPNAVKEHLIGEIISRIEKNGFVIEDIVMKHMTREEAERFYQIHREKYFFNELVDYITSGKVIALLLKGENAQIRLRQLIGSTDPKQAGEGTMRKDFGTDITHNAVHASNPDEDPEREINFFFRRESG